MNVGDILALARRELPANEARLLLQQILDVSAVDIAAHPERMVADADHRRFLDCVARRAAGEPIAYLLGHREFHGRDFAVSPAVLIPRPETELLVDIGRAKLKGRRAPRILDLGTGSGCVVISLALELDAAATAVDLSGAALEVARANASRHGAKVNFQESDWFAAVTGVFDLITANPPYVAEGDVHLTDGDLRFEPPLALSSGADGLVAIRRIVADAPQFLAPGGWLFLEHGYDQAEAVRTLLATEFTALEQHRDLAGIVRISGGKFATNSSR